MVLISDRKTYLGPDSTGESVLGSFVAQLESFIHVIVHVHCEDRTEQLLQIGIDEKWKQERGEVRIVEVEGEAVMRNSRGRG